MKRPLNMTLLTDLYEITMMQGYYKTGNQKKVIFDLFYRENPCQGGYAIACGLDQLIDHISNLQFSSDDIRYLRSLSMFDEDFLDWLSTFRFSGSIYAVPEGTVVFPREPLVKVVAPIMEAQLVETALLNIVNHQTLIATKAARVCYAAGNDGVMEFGLRRAQGPDAGIYGARAAVIGGCNGTSNVLAGQIFDMPVKGTHAHSWIMSFPDEYTAFRHYAELYPNACILLIDTYDTIRSGLKNAIRVFTEMREEGIELKNYGIRMDSGDLAYLSKKVREELDAAGFPDAIISASNDLDEYLITSLKQQGATITSWGVGTSMITSKDCPALGGVYKLAAIQADDGTFIPKIKLSENTEKVTNPGDKDIIRIYDKESGKIRADLICLAGETFDESQDLIIFDPNETWKRTLLEGGTYTMRPLLAQIFDEGKCVYTSPTAMEIREIRQKEMDTLWDENKRLVNPAKVYVDLSDKLYDLKASVLNELSSVKFHK
ncbi:MAG: nicotinate phosphoribosyltransferase [Lachnospiraceae bacterium]|nr:nicotinate phosphoribosyltransferase [Lachnospiraceae bacterium]